VRVLVSGGGGQLATALIATAAGDVEVRAPKRDQCDITDRESVERIFDSFGPDVVFNTAAYTAVDAAEDNRDLAFLVNAEGARNISLAARRSGARLIHISTDYVFDGRATIPYPPDAPANPINVYGDSKLKGELLVLESAPDATIVRAGWLYSKNGKNFLKSILGALESGRPLSVVVDQHGCPTSAHELAVALWLVARGRLTGIYHWANAGSASWYDFATEIARNARQIGLIKEETGIRRVTSNEYGSRAARPRYSVLDSTKLAGALGVAPLPWQEALQNEIRGDLAQFLRP
jgi:dTDP-4-dehydrorhamnose reductase